MIRIRTLGESTITVGTREISPKARALFRLLLYLGIERGRRIPRASLAALMWGETNPEKANHSLRQTLYELRKLGVRLGGDSTYVALSLSEVDVDLARLERGDASAVESALAGDFLPDISAEEQGYIEWLDAVRERVNAQRRRVLLDELFRSRGAGQLDGVERVARELRRIDPLNEEANCALAECLAARGSKVEALSTLDSYVREIGDDKRSIRLPAKLLTERITREARAHAEHNLTVGRDDTLSTVRMAIEKVINRRQGTCIWVSGEPGIGKTHLLDRVSREAAIRGMITATTDCPDRQDNRPLATITELTQRLLSAPGALGCAPDALGLLRRLTSEPGSVGNYPGTDGDAREAIATAFSDLVESVVLEEPLMLQVDDAQWIDLASLTTLQHVMTKLSTWPCVLVFGSRLPAPASVASTPAVVEISLQPLDQPASEALARALTQDDDKDSSAVEWIARVGGGHPLHIHELSHEVLRGNLGQVPRSLQELLRSKLRTLSSDAENILLAIALLDNHATPARLEKLLELEPSRMWNGFKELGCAGLIQDDGHLTRIRHDLIADALLGITEPGVLRYAHHRVAQVLGDELRTRQGSVEMTWASAQHWRNAGQPQRAQPLVHSCIQHLLDIGLFEEAIRLLEEFLSEATLGADRAAFLNELGFVYATRKEWQHALREFDRARVEFCSPIDPGTALGQAITEAEWKQGRLSSEQAIKPFRDCLLSASSETTVRLAAATRLLIIADYSNNDSLADETFKQLGDLKCAVLGSEGRREVLRAETIYASFRGNFEEAVRCAAQLLDELRPLRSPLAMASGHLWYANAMRRAGFIDRTKEQLLKAINLLRGKYSLEIYAHTRVMHALLEFYHGDLHTAVEILDEVAEAAGDLEGRVLYFSTDYLVTRAKTDLELGAPIKALERIDRVDLPGLRAHMTNAYLQAIAVRARATLCLKRDVPESAATEIVAYHLANRHRASQDYCALTSYELLVSQRRESEARKLIADYIASWRTDRYPVIRQLQRVVEALPMELRQRIP